MPAYRCIATDLRTGTRIAELPLTNLRFGSLLNSCGDLSATLPLPALTSTATSALAGVFNDAVDEGRRQLIVDRDGVVVWCGIVWMAPYDDNPPTRTIRAAETWSYFRRRLIASTRTFTAVDQMSIAQQLISTAIADQGGDIGVTVESSTSGVTLTQVYNSFELKPVAEAVEQLSQAENGFDFAVDAAWNTSTGALTKTFRTSYPRRGRSFSQTGLVFEVGRNVIDWTWPTDGASMANKVYALGRSDGAASMLATAADTYQILALSSGGPGYPLLETTMSRTDVSVQTMLNSLAQSKLQAVSTPVTLPEITVRADVDPVFGSYITGDSCRFIVPPDTSPRFPDGLDRFVRIVGWDVSVSDDGAESVKLILGDEFSG